MLTVAGPAYTNRYGQLTWKEVRVKCDCGTEIVFSWSKLYLMGRYKYSCGCRKRTFEVTGKRAGRRKGESRPRDLTGISAGRLTVLQRTDEPRDGGWREETWACLCAQCGAIEQYARHGIRKEGARDCDNALLETCVTNGARGLYHVLLRIPVNNGNPAPVYRDVLVTGISADSFEHAAGIATARIECRPAEPVGKLEYLKRAGLAGLAAPQASRVDDLQT